MILSFIKNLVLLFIFVLNIKSMNKNKIHDDNYISLNKLEVDNFRPDNNIVVNDLNINNFEDIDEQNIRGGGSINTYENEDMNFYKGKIYQHCSKYKLFYILGGVILAGTGVGLYFLIKHLTEKSEDNPITIPTDILTNIPESDYITDIPTTIPTSIPTDIPTIIPTDIITDIPELDCNDTSSLCNSTQLNETKDIINTYFNLTEGIDYCFGNVENKINKIGIIFDKDPNCILFTKKIVNNDFPYQKIFSDNIEYINIIFNDLKFFNNSFSNLENLKYINLTNFETLKINVFTNFFNGSNITEIEGLKNKNFTNKIDLSNFFSFTNLQNTLELNWNINVSSLNSFLLDSEGIENLTLQNFILDNSTDLTNSFNSKSLKFLNLTNICTDNSTNIDNIFNYDILEKVILNSTCNSLIIAELQNNDFRCTENDNLLNFTTCIKKKECDDIYDLCNYKSTLNTLKSKLSEEIGKIYGLDFCFGFMKNKTDKIGFIINEDQNCILFTDILYHKEDWSKSIFCHKDIFSLEVIYNNKSKLNNAFRELDLKKLDITKLIMDNIDDLSYMFYYAHILKLKGIENKNFNNPVDINNIFCASNINGTLNLSTWNITVKNLSYGFQQSHFEVVDLSNFNTSISEKLDSTFYFSGTNGIKVLYLNNWTELDNILYWNTFINSDLKKIYFNTSKNPNLTNVFLNREFYCVDYGCFKNESNLNNKNKLMIKNDFTKNNNFTGHYLNTGFNYLFGLSGNVYNITSFLVNDYIINPFQRLLRMLR